MVSDLRAIMAERRLKIAGRRRLKFCLVSASIFILSFLFCNNFDFSIDQPTQIETQKSINNEIPIAPVKTINQRMNIMIMGVDERVDDIGRSDTLMIASVNSNDDSVSLLSIPRDTRVKINHHGYDKINAAYSYGGASLSQSTVESFLGMDINHYVIVNTNSFANMIDAIGGVDINVEKRMYYEDPYDDNGGLVIDLKPGLQHMDGKTAITYVRYRDDEGDAGRVRRQQHFMRACLDKISSPSIVMHLPEILNEASNSIKTDLSINDMIALINTIKNVDKNNDNFKTGIVPGRWTYIDGVSYLIPNIERLESIVTDNLGIKNEDIKEHFEQIAYEYEDSVPYYVELSDEYDENVNKDKDRDLIDYLAERNYELTENNI